MENLEKIKQEIEQNPSQMHVDNEGFTITSRVLDIALELPVEDTLDCVDTVQKVFEYNIQLPIMPRMFSSKLLELGMSAYKSKNFEIAEKIFMILSDSGDSNGKNNYAYMIRRNETVEKSDALLIKAIRLLKDGVVEKESFSFVNLALLLAIRCGSDSDWKLSDELMKKMSDDNVFGVQRWWEDVGNVGETEGLLVHFFLLRHNKIPKSVFGDIEQLSKKLSEEIEGFPEWLIVRPRFNSLDAIFETILDDDFEENLAKYLDNMPRNRVAAEEILQEMTQWDEWELYKVLLQDYVLFLTKDEISKTIHAYKKKFMIPLSRFVDESQFKDIEKESEED